MTRENQSRAPIVWNVLRAAGSFVANLLTAIIGTVILDSGLYRLISIFLRLGTLQASVLLEDSLSAVCAFALGFLVYYKWRSRSAKWVWLVGTILFGQRLILDLSDPLMLRLTDAESLRELAGYGSDRYATVASFAAYTLPFVRTAFYSLGALCCSRFADRKKIEAHAARLLDRISAALDPSLHWSFMFHILETRIAEAIAARIESLYGLKTPVQTEQPKQSSFGEIAVPAAFQLARQLKKAPKSIAAEISQGLEIEGVSAIEIAGNGYLNLRLDRAYYATSLLSPPAPAVKQKEKIIVEHTNINPNKAAHIGHLRNAILGDTFVRMMRAAGMNVEVQNYIDNTGVQVADVVVGFIHIEKKSPGDIQSLIEKTRFDYLCWDVYTQISAYYEDHPEAKNWRAETLHSIEAGVGAEAEIAHLVADAIVNAHLATMYRLNVEYDVLPRESEILHLKFWAAAFELLKLRQAIYFETEGKNKGCWVMPGRAFKENDTGEEDSKVIVRSNGTVTYVGKDIAYQLWKFGLLGKDFYYRQWHTYPDRHQVWASTDEPQNNAMHFGAGSRVYNVIDSRQSYLQDVVVAGLRALNYTEQAENSIHFSYEMVALSPRTCVDMGIELSEEDKRRPYVEVSGRKGLGVKADDLIDKLIEKALEEVTSRHAEEPEAVRKRVATQIAVGALRYFMLKYTRNSVIAFDFGEALSFEGETGPYVQYAAVRARNILRKLEERGENLPDFRAALSSEAMRRQLANEDCWQLLLAASKSDSAIDRAIQSGEPAHVARYAFQLAQAFSNFYHEFPVISESNPEKKTFLLWMTDYFRAQLERTLDVLGIEAPDYM
jgi:arginyl-tRNA synthetase